MQTNRFFSNARRWTTRGALVLSLLLINATLVSAAGHTWTQKTTASKPSARYGHAMSYISGDQVLLFGGYDGTSDDETWVYDLSANTWTLQSPVGGTKPSARMGYAMAYIGDDQVLLFGGAAGSFQNDTWVYDLSDDTWTLQSPVGGTKPSARSGHAMAYIGGDQVLLFGGNDVSFQNDTWVYDLSANTWTLQSPVGGTKPSARAGHAMAYIGGDQVLLFGGNAGSFQNDSWVYDLSANTWTLQSPVGGTKPSARYAHAMAYLGGDQALLFGGNDGSNQNDTWVYDLSDDTWTSKSPTTKPSARVAPAMADFGGNQALLFGGYDSGGYDGETWVYDLSANTWTQKSPTTSPSARYYHAMAYIGNEWVVLFGGYDSGGRDDETWIAGGMGPTAVTLSSFRATAPSFDLAAWFEGILRQWQR